MYTCRTCKLLKHTRRKMTPQNLESKFDAVSIEGPSIIDCLCEWHCPYYWFTTKPIQGHGCSHWKNFNGKHWL